MVSYEEKGGGEEGGEYIVEHDPEATAKFTVGPGGWPGFRDVGNAEQDESCEVIERIKRH